MRNGLGLATLAAAMLVQASPGLRAGEGTCSPAPPAGHPFVVFGPADYTRRPGRPVPVSSLFAAPAAGPDYLLRVTRRPATGREKRSRAVVTLNGTAVLAGVDDEEGRCPVIERRVALLLENTLVVELRGAPGSGITLQILGYEAEPPTTTVVPGLRGYGLAFARAALVMAGLRLGATTQAPDATVAAGYVAGQSQAAGTKLPTGSAVDVVVSDGPGLPPEPITFEVDPGLTPPPVAGLPPLADGHPRPLAILTDDTGRPAPFVENELLVMTEDAAALAAFLARWNGVEIYGYDPATRGLGALSRLHLVRIDTGLADPSTLAADIRRITPGGRGVMRVSSDAGLSLLAAAARETAGGLMATVNFVGMGSEFRHRTTTEADRCDAGGSACDGYSPNAYGWSYMARSGEQKIGVGEAWTMLAKVGRLDNKVKIAILDMGFEPSDDFPAGLVAIPNAPVPPLHTPSVLFCSGFNLCPWHGTNVLGSAMGVADNGFGGAGPAGPVADPIVVYTTYDFAFSISALAEAALAGADVVNMSYGLPVPAPLSWTVVPFDLATLAAREIAGMMLFAAAGNEDADVDDSFLGVETAWWTPCENGGVVCVGALAFDSKQRRESSNHGDEEVDIFGPGTLWLGPDPDTGAGAHQHSGTSYASPFVAGVAALVMAADPDLGQGDVERLLLEHAWESDDDEVRRYVNAAGAVQAALGNVPPTITVRTPDGATVGRGTTFELRAFATDPEDGTPGVAWTSSLDGAIGEGSRITRDDLSFGTHVITATATDAGGFPDQESITVHIVNDKPPVVTAVSPPDRSVYARGQDVHFSGAAFDENNVPGRTLTDPELSWWLDGAPVPFAVGQSADLAAFLRPGVHVATFTGEDRAGGASFVAHDYVSFDVTPDRALPGAAPAVTITYPAADATFGVDDVRAGFYGVDVTLSGSATDPEDGPLSGASLVWATQRSGFGIPPKTLGFGHTITARLVTNGLFARTDHLITLYATDSDGNVSTATVSVAVVFTDGDGDGLTTDRELLIGTNPSAVDTDGDGVWDGAEDFLGTDPLDATKAPAAVPAGMLFASTSGFPSGAALTLLEPSTGRFGVLGRPPGILGGFGLATTEAGTLYVSRGFDLITVEPLRGGETVVGAYHLPSGSGLSVLQIAYNPSDGRLYGIEEDASFLSTGQLVRIDPATAAAERIGAGALNPRLNALAFSPSGRLMAVAERPGLSDQVVELDPATGLVTADVADLHADRVFGIVFESDRRLLTGRFVSNKEGELRDVSLPAGGVSHVASVGRPVFGLTAVPCAAPCFAPPAIVSLGAVAAAFQMADVDGDGDADVVATHSGGNRILLLTGNGDGTFAAPVAFPAGAEPRPIAVGDLDRDGHPDLVTGTAGAEVSVLLSDGAGGFRPPVAFPAGVGTLFRVEAVAIADMNNDDLPDIVAGVGGGAVLLPGDGTGGFGDWQSFGGTTGLVRSLRIGNLDGDTSVGLGGLVRPNLDIVTVHSSGRVVVLFGDGQGHAARRADYFAGLEVPGLFGLGDLTGDGAPDLAVPDLDRVFIFTNDGSGALSGAVGVPVGPPLTRQSVVAAAIADFDGDGRADVATANQRSASVSVLFNRPAGFVAAAGSPFLAGQSPIDLAIGDIDGDRLPDVAVLGSGAVSVLLRRRSF